jgi:Abortive infection alpha
LGEAAANDAIVHSETISLISPSQSTAEREARAMPATMPRPRSYASAVPSCCGAPPTSIEAGCRRPDRVHAYLNNLYRLGLIWFSREPVRDRMRYHVLEAQPEVVAAMRKGGRTARTVRRSVLLTPFGEDFCETCLPLETEEEGDVLAGDRVPPAAEPVGEAQSQ